jgi:hypothetical protein
MTSRALEVRTRFVSADYLFWIVAAGTKGKDWQGHLPEGKRHFQKPS